MTLKRGILALALLACTGGCGGGQTPGIEGGPCYGNGTCNDGLSCLSQTCVNPTSGTDTLPATEVPGEANPADGPADAPVSDLADIPPTEMPQAADTADVADIPGGEDLSAPPDVPAEANLLDVSPLPEIALLPAATIDFGTVAQGVTATRTLTIRNDGGGVLVVAKAGLTIDPSTDPVPKEFAVVKDPSFGPTDGSADGSIAGLASLDVTVSFTNLGGSTGAVLVQLTVQSNCQDKPSVTVAMKATRAGSGTCDPVLVPPTTDFGTVPFGFTKELKVNLKNTGTGYCSFADARIANCEVSPFGGAAACSDPFTGTASKTFVIPAGGLPPTTSNGIGPGMAVPITVMFQPTSGTSPFGATTKFYALLRVKVLDANIPNQAPAEILVPPTPSNGTFSPNLIGGSGSAKVSVLPDQVKFGLVTVGCYSKTFKVCVYNSGTATLNISDIVMENCSSEFKLENVPGFPKPLPPGLPVCFETVYAPVDTSAATCTVRVKGDDPASDLVMVGLSGQGTYDSTQTDEFTQVSGQAVDILFIIDQSSSMCDKQTELIAAYADFINNADLLKNDYHIGLIDLNILDGKYVGELNEGNPKPPVRFLTPGTPDGKAKFQTMANMGCTGCPDWAQCTMDQISDNEESGLAAAQAALSAPLTTETGVACSTDSDCTGNMTLCGDPKTCPYYCIDKTCGGWNKGFLREDAQLECIVLSDEEDQSPASVSYYIEFLKSIKGPYNTSMFHWHSIVGQSSPSTSCAEEGKRYNETSLQTNGVMGDICDTSFSTTMNNIGKIAFGLKAQFFLTRLADPASVTVSVNGTKCSGGWKYDSVSNSVIFDNKTPSDSCSQPKPGQNVSVLYKTLCLQS